ncbi:uncharacterized protein UTRI_04481 [Ustilago trichophora]|uniref:Uncharacterized protein n=1 Tax=Ustilago trichophora TaxID=86804 RepID=A0A5C3ED86_9BASI|nr:uncharacterized protein UTRI_04481 [Ustilago trichophora]
MALGPFHLKEQARGSIAGPGHKMIGQGAHLGHYTASETHCEAKERGASNSQGGCEADAGGSCDAEAWRTASHFVCLALLTSVSYSTSAAASRSSSLSV